MTHFPISRTGPATTSGYDAPATSCNMSSRISPDPARPTTTTCGWQTQLPWSAAAAAKQQSDPTLLAGLPTGYCASHSRFFWGLRLHLLTTVSGLPMAFALAPAKQDERDTALQMIEMNPDLHRMNQTIIADKGYRSAQFETELNNYGITLIRPATRTEKTRPGHKYLKPFRQIIESVNQTLKGQLDLERHGGRTRPGVGARVLQRLLALTAAIWHNETTNRPGPARTLTPYDH